MTHEPTPDCIERPLPEAGAWLDSSKHEATWVGCDTCGWEDSGPYDDVRPRWLAHTHDPVFDIRARLSRLAGAEWVEAHHYLGDVGWLMVELERTEKEGRAL